MSNLFSAVVQQLEKEELSPDLANASRLITAFIEASAYVGEVFSIGYEEALVQIHDFNRQQVGGIPALSFLTATRVFAGSTPDIRQEDASVILLRVLDHAPLPNADEALRVRVENAQRVSGELDKTFDHRDVMDPTTNNLLGYAGVRCRVIGTFYVDEFDSDGKVELRLAFGSDISNYYPNRGLKVFKPRGDVLRRILNFRDPRNTSFSDLLVRIGEVRYASTNRPFQKISGVEVNLTPTDLLTQKTALFGMTRTGKSNTTKIILKSIFSLRWQEMPLPIGQIVFDPNGEYANENEQDKDNKNNPNAIKNVWASGPGNKQAELKKDVITYGLMNHPLDPNRRLMLLNFYLDGNLQIGKEIVDGALAGDNSKYLLNFRDVIFEPPDPSDRSASTRYARRVLCYRALLHKAGLENPANLKPVTTKLFNPKLLEAMEQSDSEKAAEYASAAAVFKKIPPNWGELGTGFFSPSHIHQ